MTTAKRNVGRPSLPENEVKKVTPVRFPDDERKAYEQAAKDAGLNLSEWIRQTLKESWNKKQRKARADARANP